MFIDKATSIFVVIYPASIAFFSIHLLKEYCPRKMFIVILWMIFWFCPFAIFAILTDHAMIALKINAGMAFIIVAVPFLAALTSRPDLKQHNPYVSKRTLSWIYGLTLAISATTILSYSGVLMPGFGENPFSLYALNLYSIASTILTSILMMARGRSRSRRLVLAESKIAAAQSEAQQERFGREQQEQLLAMLTHELKTPLAVLRMIDGTGSSSNKIISEAVQDLTSVVDRIVSANEFESGRLSFVPSSFDLIKEIQNAVANNPEFKRINLESSSSGQITSDRQLVGVALKNLVENAINYSVGPVKIKCVKKKQLFIMHFENNIDINDDVDATRVFEKFYRSNFAHRKSGSGIGLYILQGIVGEILGGQINFQRSKDKVVVTMEIPNRAT
jgi:signal transduction histidine kinase